ncbi:MAG: hypothetical protein IPL16_15525 [Ignavibacteria bacterium]|nr:hypothetical protein [Ignavibacteria bacterium]
MNEGTVYKYAVKSNSGEVVFKSDPYAFKAEIRPSNASVAVSLKKHKWNDRQWMSERKKSSVANPAFKKLLCQFMKFIRDHGKGLRK